MESDEKPLQGPNSVAQLGRGLVGVIVGFPIGAVIVFYFISLGGRVLFGRDFFQIAWLLHMFAVPIGALLGAIFGAKTSVTAPRRFGITFVPAAVFILSGEFAQYHLRRVERPQTWTVSVTTDSPVLRSRERADGRAIVGRVVADGQSYPIEGTIPATFTYNAVRIELQIERVNEEKAEWFAIEVNSGAELIAQGWFNKKGRGKLWTRGIGWWRRSDGGCYVELGDLEE